MRIIHKTQRKNLLHLTAPQSFILRISVDISREFIMSTTCTLKRPLERAEQPLPKKRKVDDEQKKSVEDPDQAKVDQPQVSSEENELKSNACTFDEKEHESTGELKQSQSDEATVVSLENITPSAKHKVQTQQVSDPKRQQSASLTKKTPGNDEAVNDEAVKVQPEQETKKATVETLVEETAM